MSKLSKLTGFLDRLDGAEIQYTLSSVREGVITICLAIPGERWEVEFLDDGGVEVERFRSDGEIQDFSVTRKLFERDGGD
jgi:hypothetical protein